MHTFFPQNRFQKHIYKLIGHVVVQFYPWFHAYFLSLWVWYSIKMNFQQIEIKFRTCLHEGGGPQVREVTCGGLPQLTFKHDQIKMRDYMDRWVTPPKRVTSPTWGPPPLCKQALKPRPKLNHKIHPHNSYTFTRTIVVPRAPWVRLPRDQI